MTTGRMDQAIKWRYAKIKRMTDFLCSEDKTVLDSVPLPKSFNVGKWMRIDGQNIIIKNKTYDCFEIKKVTINTEGSFSIYDRSGKRLCWWLELNLSVENIELFCIWARKNGIPAEVVSGKGERTAQWAFFGVVLAMVILIKVLQHLF